MALLMNWTDIYKGLYMVILCYIYIQSYIIQHHQLGMITMNWDIQPAQRDDAAGFASVGWDEDDERI